MLAILKQEDFNTMNNVDLGTACFKPLIQVYKRAQTEEQNFATDIYPHWSSGQRALFIFWTYYSHVKKSEADCYYWSALYMAQSERWSGLFRGLQFFEDRDTLPLIEEMDALLKKRNHPRSMSDFNVSYDDINNDPLLHEQISVWYAKLLVALPITIALISDYIRLHPDQFTELVESY
ncbi:hypothetical protein [Paenibacillus sp. L3-i20]|uniref:hypothetical protein n=1 Tax=Paenibacillus sp. L3-i20 TaxID=2905833 RepID=UPI001EDCF140|nr:hypothetical protein [Paenibacillus sp. L3-i20]GKU76364.1 hypothetical protein L3i20_v207610 [Paenibacillus sp. L3-i20]